MKILSLTTIMTIFVALLTPVFICPSALQAAGITEDRNMLMAQYIEDKENGRDNKSRKGTIQDYRNRELAQPLPRFIMGIAGGLDAREGFGSAYAAVPLGMQYGKFAVTADLAFIYTNAKSLRSNKAGLMDTFLRTTTSGQVFEFNLPVKFIYSILDLESYLYTPYLTAGLGYSYRIFHLRASSALNRISREYSLNSFTLNYGFGFLVRTSEDTRFNVGITGISYFNNRSDVFNYDTTGVSILLGLLLIF